MPAPLGDPRRPIQLAIRSCWWLGIIFVLLGSLVVGVFGVLPASPGRGGPAHWLLMSIGLVYLVPGLLYILFAVFLTKRQAWAVTATMVLSGIHGLFALFATFGSLIQQKYLAFAIGLAWAAAMAQLIWHLSKSFESIRSDPDHSPRGFAPLPVGTIDAPAVDPRVGE